MGRSMLFGFLVLLVLVLPGLPAVSAGKDDKDKITLTIKAKCEGTGVSKGPDFSLDDRIIVTLNETNTYRIVFFDDVEGAQLELLSHKTTIEAQAGGAFKSSAESRSWSYSAQKGKPTNPVCGLRISFLQGTGRIQLGNFVDRGDIKASDDLALAMASGMAKMGITFLTSDSGSEGSASQFREQLQFKFKPKEKSFTITGHAAGTWEVKGDDGSGTAKVQVDYTVTAGTPEILEAVLIPKTNYKKWLPKASGQGADVAGVHITFDVELRTPEGDKAKEKTATFEFELVDTSHEPGTCMNSPWVNTDADLKIMRDVNPNLAEVSGDGQTAKTSKGLKSTSITISCFDGAASGKLKAVARIDGENEDVLDAHLEGQPDLTEVAIPYDSDNNKIADAWEEDNDTTGKSVKTDDDEEPQGDRHKGDGLTIWEEYRGFLEDRKFIRTDPRKKDFFACDNIGGKTQMALNRLEALAKLKVHGKLRIDELGTSRVINRNRASDDTNVVDQHGVLITNWSTAGLCIADGGPGTPKSINRVLIDSNLRDTVTKKLSPTNTKTFPYYVRTVAHELLHCCNVWHHGQCDTRVVWKAETVDGATSIYEYSNAADCGNPDKGSRIKVYLENNGGVYVPTDEVWSNPITVWLGRHQGQHSGVEDCVMRYDCSWAALKGSDRYCYIWEDQEPVGQGLCVNSSGTGVNAEGRAPISRYKDAAADRGNCADQICVNDLYH